jgi:serine/threonine protein kinase
MLAPGTLLQNRYRVSHQIGGGGMGAVYQATDTRLGVPVALKEMLPQPGLDPQTLAQLRRQFQQEATVLARLDHNHLVDVTDFFEEEGNAYLVMKFIEGESLAKRIEQRGALPEAEVLAWADQLLDALAYCHSQGVIHRDIKPQNVIIRPGGQAVLVDFGLFKLWDPHDPHTKTVMRGMGTPEYAPPEQYDAEEGHTDPRSDIYGLGATLYHALTGKKPPTATMRIVNPTALKPIQSIVTQASAQTEAAVTRSMELRPADRFQSAQKMAAALGIGTTAQAHITLSRPDPTRVIPAVRPAIPAAPPKRTGLWIALGAGGVLLIGLVAAVMGGALALPSQVNRRAETPVPASVEPTTPPPTATPTPTPEPTSPPVPTPTATVEVVTQPPSNVREAARLVVEGFQAARTTAYSTWDTTPYYDVLAGEALDSSLKVIAQIKAGECRYYITEDAEMQIRYEEESTHRVVVIASRSETQQRVCAGSVEYVCQAFDGRYVVEKMSDRWLITDKSVLNYREVSPCP